MRFKKARSVFTTPKVHTKKRRLRLTIEILLISLVLIGTVFSVLRFRDFSFEKLTKNFQNAITLKKPTQSKTDQISVEAKIKELIDKKILTITSIEKSEGGFAVIKSKEKTSVIISTEKNLENQAKTLQTVLSKAKIEEKEVSLVDFRFDKLIVRYK